MTRSAEFVMASPPTEDDLVFEPVILAGDPLAQPDDSPSIRIDPNVATSPYAGVVSVRVSSDVGNFLCSGTVISKRHILTAAHCLDVQGADGVLDLNPSEVTVNFNVGGNLSAQIVASELAIFPQYRGFFNTLNQDLAIITLSEDVPDGVPIYPLYRGDVVPGDIVTVAGYGATGDGVAGQIDGSASFSTKRVGQNQLEDVSRLENRPDLLNTYLFDFDDPTGLENSLVAIGSGGSLGNDVETTLGIGDSGGPGFFEENGQLQVMGVNTFVFDLPNFTIPNGDDVQGKFGSGGGGVLIGVPEKLVWIDSFLTQLTPPGSVAGVLWWDANQNGLREAQEKPLEDWRVFVDANQNSQWDPGEIEDRSSSAGEYLLEGVPVGTSVVAVEGLPDWQLTYPEAGEVTLLAADFSQTGQPNLDGFALDNSGGEVAGFWGLSQGRGSDPGHSAADSLYFGSGETASGGGTYDVGWTAGRATSPAVNLRGLSAATLSFNYFLEVEPETSVDLAQVLIARDGGEFQLLADKEKGLEPDAGAWQSASFDLAPFLGSTVQIQFAFNTVDGVANDFEGWYVDDVVVAGSGGLQRIGLQGGEALTGISFGFTPASEPSPPESPTAAGEVFFVDYAQLSQGLGQPVVPFAVGGLPFAQLYDEGFYLQENKDVAAAVMAGLFASGYDHFIQMGWREGRSPSSLFDEAFYLQQNGDVGVAIATTPLSSGFEHFVRHGHVEGRDPSANFSQADYLAANPDVAAAVAAGLLPSAFAHYVRYGAQEGREPQLALFSEGYYLEQNADVGVAIATGQFTSGLSHYLSYGCQEGRSPSANFSEASYLAANPDVAAAVSIGTFACGAEHFWQLGRFEERALA